MFDLPNSVIPTGTDHRKAMICGVEGPVLVMPTVPKDAGDRIGIDDTKERQGDFVHLQNIPTQAKTGLEWATRQVSRIRL